MLARERLCVRDSRNPQETRPTTTDSRKAGGEYQARTGKRSGRRISREQLRGGERAPGSGNEARRRGSSKSARPGERRGAADAIDRRHDKPTRSQGKCDDQYQEKKKAAISDTAAAQKELALWCDQHGLWDGAKTHWGAVVRLDAKNEEARRRLGFRLRDRAWVFDAASAEDVAQRKANSYWKVLEKYHSQMKCRSKLAVPGRSDAVAHVEAVGDPRAAAAIWKVFAADIGHHDLIVGNT